jgi:succinate dehydrogenase / fumarate reductase cytochrome b subunit
MRNLRSSIGKKQMMAVTGLAFSLFLVTHLAGNLTLYGGRDLFLSYVEHLHSLGYLVTAAEFVLGFLALVHIGIGLLLFIQNKQARPVNYAVKKGAGGQTIGSLTAPYTGILILIFLIFHLLRFRFTDKTGTNDFLILSGTFEQVAYVIFYVAAMVVIAVHVSHGFWSGFQTLGLSHPKYMPFIMRFSPLFAWIVGAAFSSIPFLIFLTGGGVS